MISSLFRTPLALKQVGENLLRCIDPDPQRNGLAETPARFAKAWMEWTEGYAIDPSSFIKTFEDEEVSNYDQIVLVSNIAFTSHCEHHLAPITGVAHVGYIPNKRVLGLSKFARIVDAYARRLQVQERMTVQIADLIYQSDLEPEGVGVIIRAAHGCMSSRGVHLHGSTTTTSAVRGLFVTDDGTKAEFINLCRDAERSHGR